MTWILVLIAYLLGSIPFAYLIVRERAGVDVRNVGSGNVGATNVLRISGRGPALAVLLLDMAKGCFPVLLGRLLGAPPEALAAIAVAAVLGHVFPVFLGFRGGKGVATAVGAFLALAPIATASSIAVFVLVLVWKRYVSLGSIAAVTTFPLWAYLYGRVGWMSVPWPAVFVAGLTTAILVLVKHRSNLRRIGLGVESRLGERWEEEK